MCFVAETLEAAFKFWQFLKCKRQEVGTVLGPHYSLRELSVHMWNHSNPFLLENLITKASEFIIQSSNFLSVSDSLNK